eukprot:3824325-Prymnesium_polylepis.3
MQQQRSVVLGAGQRVQQLAVAREGGSVAILDKHSVRLRPEKGVGPELRPARRGAKLSSRPEVAQFRGVAPAAAL